MRLDLHVHTNHSLDCPEDVVKIVNYAKKKMDGIAVTDHDEIEGALEARKLWENVIVGEEVTTEFGELLAYHIQEKIKSRRVEEVIDEVMSQGGLVGASHPFDVFRKNVIEKKTLLRIIDKLDFIEGMNARCLFFLNSRAQALAKKYGKRMTAGSDAHFVSEIGCAYTEADFELKRIEGIKSSVSPFRPLLRLALTKIYKIKKGIR